MTPTKLISVAPLAILPPLPTGAGRAASIHPQQPTTLFDYFDQSPLRMRRFMQRLRNADETSRARMLRKLGPLVARDLLEAQP